MNIKDIDLKSLKALAYDEGLKLEQARMNIQTINSEIIERMKQAASPNKEAAKPKKEEAK